MGYTVELRFEWPSVADGGNDARSRVEYRLAKAAAGQGHRWTDAEDRFLLRVASGSVLFGRHGQEDVVLPLRADDLGIDDVTLPGVALCVDEVSLGPLGTVTRIGCGARGEAGRWRLLSFPTGYHRAEELRPGMWIESTAGSTFQLDVRSLGAKWRPLLHGAVLPDVPSAALPPTRTTPPTWLCEEARAAREGYDLAARGRPMNQEFKVLRTAAYVALNGLLEPDFRWLMERQGGPTDPRNLRLPRVSKHGGLGYYLEEIGSNGRLGEEDRPVGGIFYGRASVQEWAVVREVAYSLYLLGFLRDADFDGLSA